MIFTKHNMDDTLPDDAWKDSFDRLLDQRSLLRERNIIKRDVHASFNIDSSVENSNPKLLGDDERSWKDLQILDNVAGFSKKKKRELSISTPCAKRLHAHLFNCALSPITGIRLDGLKTQLGSIDHVEQAKPRKTKQVCFYVDTLISEQSNDSILECKRPTKSPIGDAKPAYRQSRSSIILLPGKWRKSLNTWRRANQHEKSDCTIGLETRDGTLDDLRGGQRNARKSVHTNRVSEPEIIINYEKQVLKLCKQLKPYKFSTAYSATKLLDACKIGEGVFGEVFKYTPRNGTRSEVVLKVLPIEGDALVNEEAQKTYEQILPEIVISQEMSNLRTNPTNSTSGFVDIYNVSLVKGKYPKHLISLWEAYDAEKESENDHPKMFTDNQLFIVLELKYAGIDMSTFVFLNAEQTYFALQQIILTLAIGEEVFQFEHRDLHWGNILIEKTDKKLIDYKLCGKDMSIATKGIRITIIDYTLSRVTVGECCHYNDLSQDEDLFAATGDYQYEIYRMMRQELKNNWSSYNPKTNVQWISYVNSKLIDGVNYKSTSTKAHKTYMEKLKDFHKIVLNFGSAVECIQYLQQHN